MQRRAWSQKEVLIVAVVLPAVLFLAVVLFLGSPSGASRERDGASRMRTGPLRRILDPGTAYLEFRQAVQAQSPTDGAFSETLRSARDAFAGLGDRALPAIRTGIYSADESARFRLELVSLLSEIRTPAAEATLVSLFADVTLDPRYRVMALTRIPGSRSNDARTCLVRVLEEERGFPARHLILKAIGDGTSPDGVPILIRAASEEPSTSARLQAIDSLSRQLEAPNVAESLKQAVRRDPEPTVRLSALLAITRGTARWVDEFLGEIAAGGDQPPEVRASAAQWLTLRQK